MNERGLELPLRAFGNPAERKKTLCHTSRGGGNSEQKQQRRIMKKGSVAKVEEKRKERKN